VISATRSTATTSVPTTISGSKNVEEAEKTEPRIAKVDGAISTRDITNPINATSSSFIPSSTTALDEEEELQRVLKKSEVEARLDGVAKARE
jgi:hypothetical protein